MNLLITLTILLPSTALCIEYNRCEYTSVFNCDTESCVDRESFRRVVPDCVKKTFRIQNKLGSDYCGEYCDGDDTCVATEWFVSSGNPHCTILGCTVQNVNYSFPALSYKGISRYEMIVKDQCVVNTAPTLAPSTFPTASSSPTVATMNPTTAPSPGPPAPPAGTYDGTNILIIMTDDIGMGDTDGTGIAQTPNFDRFRTSPSTVFMTNTHSGSVVCSPSRAALITGRNPHREYIATANTRYVWPTNMREKFRAKYPLRTDVTTIADMVKMANNTKYNEFLTGKFGKWHLGEIMDHGEGRFRPLKEYGYDRGFASAHDIPTYRPYCFRLDWAENCWINSWVGGSDNRYYSIVGEDMYYDIDGNGLGRYDSEHVPRTTSEFLFEKTLEFIDEAIEYDRPFFAEVTPHLTHYQFVADPDSYLRCRNGEICQLPESSWNMDRLAEYHASIYDLDKAFGMLLDGLESRGLYNNTLIIMTSDNGAESQLFETGFRHQDKGFGDIANYDPSDVGWGLPGTMYDKSGQQKTLKAAKRDLFEGGSRVGMMVSYPAIIKENRVLNVPFSHVDIFPTIADILGVENSTNDTIDGISFVPFLRNTTLSTRETPVFVCADQLPNSGLSECEWLFVKRDNFKLYTNSYCTDYRLFDIDYDLEETTDISSSHPDIVSTLCGHVHTFLTSVNVDRAKLTDIDGNQVPQILF